MKQKKEEDKREKVEAVTNGLTELGMFSFFVLSKIFLAGFKLVLAGEKDWILTKKFKLHE